ncbi:MAG: hypothetical protein ACI91G_000340 [Gammaproteobacteria bacterium]|jgi:uncharacterized protein (DUF1499 family)
MKIQQLILKPLCAAFAAAALSSCATLSNEPSNTGTELGRLQPCPSAPHCVSSDSYAVEEKTSAYIKPFELEGLPHVAWEATRTLIEASERTSIVQQRPGYLHAEVVSPWKFYTDDLELRLDQSQRVIHVRSSSRIGYYDFGVNRDRVERLRSELLAKGLIKG